MSNTILTQIGKKPRNPIKYTITLSDEQKKAKTEILEHPYNFIVGEAGSGKTLLAVQIALDSLFNGYSERIVITRPSVSTEDNGFLPGTLEAKLEPWLVPIISNIQKVYPHQNKIEKMREDGVIEIVSLEHFRGRTFENAICIIDEFQNLTKAQLSMVLSRLGKNSIMILAGDSRQIDLKYKQDSAVHEIPKLDVSAYVHVAKLLENHRNEAVSEILRLLHEY